VTMVKDGERAEALAVKKGRILAMGPLKEVMAQKGSKTQMVDLKGKCLMPGFFDPHSHIVMQSVKFSTANLDPKPIGQAGSIADIQRILREWIDNNKLKPGEWVIGWGIRRHRYCGAAPPHPRGLGCGFHRAPHFADAYLGPPHDRQ
jgi:predicted amidohydrolase YtcJ